MTLSPQRILCGDALSLLKGFPAESVSLIVTSPPYAGSRSRLYFSPSPEEYGDWFLPIS